MRLSPEALADLRSNETLELHGEPNAYGGRPVIARARRDAAGMAGTPAGSHPAGNPMAIVERWQEEARSWLGERGPAADVLARVADLTGRDDWERTA